MNALSGALGRRFNNDGLEAKSGRTAQRFLIAGRTAADGVPGGRRGYGCRAEVKKWVDIEDYIRTIKICARIIIDWCN